MIIKSPLLITPRLLPGLKIADSFISIDFYKTKNGRYYYGYWIDTPSYEYKERDISSRKYDIQEALSTLLSFLSAAAEAHQSILSGNSSDNADLFPSQIMEWAYQHSDEISMLALELEENKGLIVQ